MKMRDVVVGLQLGMNALGENLTVDGDAGPKTQAALLGYDVEVTVRRTTGPNVPAEFPTDLWRRYQMLAPHVFEAMTMLGWDEVKQDKELTALCWPFTDDCKHLKSVIGAGNAWCSGFWCGVNQRKGMPHTRDGSASSWRTFGVPCGFIFGAFLPIVHPNGSNHVGVFLWWIDEKKKIAAVLGGNQGNKVSIAAYDLSGSGDRVFGSPRWPLGMPMTEGPYQPPGWKVGTKLGASTR